MVPLIDDALYWQPSVFHACFLSSGHLQTVQRQVQGGPESCQEALGQCGQSVWSQVGSGHPVVASGGRRRASVWMWWTSQWSSDPQLQESLSRTFEDRGQEASWGRGSGSSGGLELSTFTSGLLLRKDTSCMCLKKTKTSLFLTTLDSTLCVLSTTS